MTTKLKRFIKPKHVKEDVQGLCVQIDRQLYLKMREHLDRKKGLTWRVYVEAMIEAYLADVEANDD